MDWEEHIVNGNDIEQVEVRLNEDRTTVEWIENYLDESQVLQYFGTRQKQFKNIVATRCFL